jgi:hypothetical protein
MAVLDFSPEADDAWAHILEHDHVQALALDAAFDQLERDASSLRAIAYDIHARLTTVPIPGRGESGVIVWRPETDGVIRVEHVGRAHL